MPPGQTFKYSTVMGGPNREVNSTVGTGPKLKVADQDRVNNS